MKIFCLPQFFILTLLSIALLPILIMAIARKHKIDITKAGYYQLSNKCSRQAFALGKGPAEKLFYERKAMIEELLCKLCICFMVKLIEWNLMDNHYHILLFFNPRWMKELSDQQVAELVFQLDLKSPDRPNWSEQKRKRWMEKFLADKQGIRKWRKNLCSPSKFMYYFNETIAKRCNQQDGIQGHFWQGRFHSITLEDSAAVLRSACYVALNCVRAQMCERLEDSPHSGIGVSILSRLEVNELYRMRSPRCAGHIKRMAEALYPVEEWFADSDWQLEHHLTYEEYVGLCEAYGSIQRLDKRGYLKQEHLNVLKRYGISDRGGGEVLLESPDAYPYRMGSPKVLRATAKQNNRNWYRGVGQAEKDYEDEP